LTRFAWTLLIYMAADNDLASQGVRDLEEMLAVGASPEVAVVVLFDRKHRGATRYRIPSRPGVSRARCPQNKLGKINMGDPATLADFLRWGQAQLPARRRALILWDHGDGWRPYNPLNPSGGLRTKRHFSARVRVQRAGMRPQYIGIDDQGRGSLDDDWLDMGELRQGLAQGLGGRPLDLLGFDACLMSQLEVLYEVRDTASVIVGSEEEMPLTGLPYREVLGYLNQHTDTPPGPFAEAIAKSFLAWGPRRTRRTHSIIEPKELTQLARTTSDFGDAVAERLPRQRAEVLSALKGVQRYSTKESREYADLLDTAKKIARSLKHRDVSRSVEALEEAVGKTVRFNGTTGVRLEGSHGISVYMPRRRSVWDIYRPSYHELEFAKDCGGWTRFLDALFAE